jgi:hypothetical protein
VIVTVVVVLTLVVVTVPKPKTVDPAGTVTLGCRLATAGLLLDSETTAPPAGAALDSVTYPDVLLPPVTLDGLTVTLCNVAPLGPAGVMVNVAERVFPL